MKILKSEFPVDFRCPIFSVSKSGFYAWCNRDVTQKKAEDFKLLSLIQQIHQESRSTYGSPRVFGVLKEMGEQVSRSQVEKIMRSNGIFSKVKRKVRLTTDSKHPLPVAPNLLKRNFSPEAKNQNWAGDLTSIWTRQGGLFLAVGVDLFSRQIVGWSLSKTMTKNLVISAIDQAIERRQPGSGLIFHSDRGSQYCSSEFRQVLQEHRIMQSQSRKANCWDNACVVSFFHTLKTEALYHEDFETRIEAERFIFEWVESFYHRFRLHSTLGYKSPVDFEQDRMKVVA
jgi:transposase InsO family protein